MIYFQTDTLSVRPQRQRIRAAPGDAALAIDVLEVADEEHAEVNPWRQARLPAGLGLFVERGAARFDPAVEAGFGEEFVQLLVERVPGGRRDLIRRDEKRFLPRLAFAHGHRRVPAGKSE